MSIETEIKLRIREPVENVRRRIMELGAVLEETVFEKDIYFQHPCRDFGSTDEALRLRLVIDSDNNIRIAKLTYKGPRKGSGIKRREEIEAEIVDIDNVVKILNKLGFIQVAEVNKKREYYRLGTCNISLDQVSELGEFIEIECDEDSIREIIKQLKIRYEIVDKTYLELLIEKRQPWPLSSSDR